MADLTIPAGVSTPEDKIAYCLRVVELLRLEHNKKGAKVGVDISLADFRAWQTGIFEPVNEKALGLANQAKQELYQSTKWDDQIDAPELLGE